jgi:beta-glucanase (GH16 family)
VRRRWAAAALAPALALAACGSDGPPASSPSSSSPASGPPTTSVALPEPAFADEFDDPAATEAGWERCYYWQPTHCTNEFNEELEAYVPEGVEVVGGELRLTARPEDDLTGFLFDGTPHTFPYSSGMVTSLGHFEFTYGYVEARARVPAGRGLWPAIWMLPSSHETPPEIDVMEYVGHEPATTFHTVHRPGDDSSQVTVPFEGPVADGFHVFGVRWEETAITYYVDGVERGRITRDVPAVPMYLLANLAVGGEWPGPPDASTAFPATFAVDYIRVWTGPAAGVAAAAANG